MSDFDFLLKSTDNCNVSFSEDEAKVGLALLLMYADGSVSGTEEQKITRLLQLIKGKNEEYVELNERFSKVIQMHGFGALFNALKVSLNTPVVAERALAVAMRMAIADGFLDNKESDFLVAAADALGISETRYFEIEKQIMGNTAGA